MKLFLWIYDYLSKRRILRTALMVALFGLLATFASRISLEEDISGFLPDNPENEKINYLYKNISIADKIIIRLSMSDTLSDVEDSVYELIEAADIFVEKLDSLTGEKYIKTIQKEVDQQAIGEIAAFITENIPYFLTESDYDRMDSIITNTEIAKELVNNRQMLLSPIGMGIRQNIMSDPLHFSVPVLERLKSFQISDQYHIIEDHIFTRDGKNLMIFIDSANPSSETKNNTHLAKSIEQAVSTVSENIKIDYFGANLIAVTNAQQIKRDSLMSISIAIILILTIMILYFRSFRSLSLIVLSIGFGIVTALAMMYLLQDVMSAIAVGAGSVIFGISINYPIHFLIHHRVTKDPRATLKDVFSPLTVGNITTVGAFLSLLFISAGSMRDFGLMAAFSLLGTIFFVLIFLPHLSGKDENRAWQDSLAKKLDGFKPEKSRWLMIFLICFTVIMWFFSRNVSFEADMQKINYMTDSQRKQFAELSDVTVLGKKNIYLVAEGTNLDEALSNYELQQPLLAELKSDSIQLITAGIGTFLPSEAKQKEKIERWNLFWATRAENLIAEIDKRTTDCGFTEGAFDSFSSLLRHEYAPQSLEYFTPLRNNLMKDYLIERDGRAMVVTMLYAPTKDADAVEAKFENLEGSFIFDSGSIVRSLVKLLTDDFDLVLYMCMLIVFISFLFAFGRIEITLIAFLPMALSWIWILGIMQITDIRFNIVNIVLATFIFGLGDDYNVFVTDGLMRQWARGKKLLNSFRISILLSAVTMFIGIGTLILAKHPAMKSLGQVTIIGMFAVVFAAYTITPYIFRKLTTTKRGEKRTVPVTLLNLTISLFVFSVFVIGSIYLQVSGFILLTLGKKTETNKLRFHKQIQKVADFVVRKMPRISHRQIGEVEDFNHPAVIVCNHQAHLDLMYVLRLSPKIVVLTNEWVWESPFYGNVIRKAEFLPVMNGIENCVEKLHELVERGYSIVVFPEGSRSEDCSINRFHRGAFFLAQELGLDIIPIVFHGIGNALPKREMLLRKGSVTTNILPRIKYDDKSFGEDYMQRAKMVRQYFIREYDSIARQVENVAYYTYLVRHSYVYKGSDVEKEAKKELKLNAEVFQKTIDSLPESGNILIRNCGIGVFSLFCSLIKKNITFTATDPDIEKLELADYCASKPKNLTYVSESEWDVEYFDLVIDAKNMKS